MFIFAWLAIGLTAGFGVGMLVNRGRQSLLFDTLMGVIGAISGAWVFHRVFGGVPMNVITAHGIAASSIGAASVVLLYHEIFIQKS